MKKSVLTLSIAAMLSIPFAARASLVLGTLNFGGAAEISATAVPETGSIIFTPAFTITGPQGGDFTGFDTSGIIFNIVNPPDSVDTNLAPLDQTLLTFDHNANIVITLTELLGGTYPDANCGLPALVNQGCTPGPPSEGALSPYDLVDTSTGSTDSIHFLGVETDSLTSTSIGVTGSLTETSNDSYETILSIIEGGGMYPATFAGTLSTDSTPEPGTLTELMMGISLVGIGLVYRKKLKRA
jgi:hypothetical protein